MLANTQEQFDPRPEPSPMASFGEYVAVTRARFHQQVHFSAVRLEESPVQL